MIRENGQIIKGYWENDEKKEYISENNNFKLLKIYEPDNLEKKEKDEIEHDDIKINDNEFDLFLKDINITTQNCQVHKNLIIGLCIDKDCKEKNKLLCQKCLFKEHKKHDVIEIEEYSDKVKENMINLKKIISEIKEIKENKGYWNKEYGLKITEIKKNINLLIDQKVESFISPIFEKIMNEKEKFLNQKIIKFKKNYPIDCLDKQVGITNLIFTLQDIDFNNKIDCINDIFNIKIKNIESEVKGIISSIFDNKDSNLYELDNPWTKEILNENIKEFSYELEENDCLIRKKNGPNHIAKTKLQLKEGNTYIVLFHINISDWHDFGIGFGNIDLIKTEREIYLSKEGLFIDGKNITEKIEFENNGEICFIVLMKEEKFLFLFNNGKYVGKFNFNLTNIYALASIGATDDSIKIKTFLEI